MQITKSCTTVHIAHVAIREYRLSQLLQYYFKEESDFFNTASGQRSIRDYQIIIYRHEVIFTKSFIYFFPHQFPTQCTI